MEDNYISAYNAFVCTETTVNINNLYCNKVNLFWQFNAIQWNFYPSFLKGTHKENDKAVEIMVTGKHQSASET